MSDWAAGYVSDVGYTYGYYTELNPLRVRLAFLYNGLVCPEFGTACELGFGQGLSANLHAAASVTRWYGTDFNPAQAGCARELAKIANADAQLFDEAFTDFAKRDDLPEFDFIGLHGIWSWISDENRTVIVDFIRRKLRVGGVVYISYNTLPGWAAFAPMRHLMAEHAEVIGSEGRGIVSRIDDAIEFADKLLATNPIFSRANPLVGERIQQIKGQNRHYLAHEYFNKDWHPMHFATMAEWLEPAKLNFACSSHYVDHVDAVNLTAEQQTFLSEVPDIMFRQSVRDFMVNQQFRRDYWVKGARRLSALEQTELLRAERVMLAVYRPDVSLKVTGSLGEADLNGSIYNPILDFLADHRVRSLAEIEVAVREYKISIAQIVQAILLLASSGRVVGVQDEDKVNGAKESSRRLNAYLINKARSGGDISHLSSPLTGGGIAVGRFPQLFLLAISQGFKQPAEWAQFAWAILDSQGQKILKDGSALDSSEKNLSELTSQAEIFAEKLLPVLKALQVV